MRLICPNCDAEYEVDDAAIPEGGRDVQCSNCGHAWFQLPADVEAALADEEALFGDPGPDEDEAPEPESQPQAASRRTLDENLMAVLREEAEREAAARRSEAAVTMIETQTEMPLAAPDIATGGGLAAAAARRIARLKGADPDIAPPPEAAKPASRRGLLPDIEEINSSLRSGAAELDAASVDEPSARGGFRSGFVLSLLLAAGAAGAYAMAPKISEQIPASKAVLDGYVQSVDAGRLWLDGAMRRATAAIQGMTADSGQ